MKTLYIQVLPETIPCWYCAQPCQRAAISEQTMEYECQKHLPLEVMFRCVQHKVGGPNWFFNVVKLTLKDWRLHWNFYSGNTAQLEKQMPERRNKNGSYWKTVYIEVPASFITTSPIEQLRSYLNLYKVWS